MEGREVHINNKVSVIMGPNQAYSDYYSLL